MNKRKPYSIIIAVLCLATLVSFFLPFLHLPEQEGVTEGYSIDPKTVALESNIIKDVSRSEGIGRNIVYTTARSILEGRDRDRIESRLFEDEYYIIDVLEERLEQQVKKMEELGGLEKRDYSYFGTIGLSAYVIKHFNQNMLSAFLVIFTMIATVILSLIAGAYKLAHIENYKSYKLVKILSLINIVLSLLGLISINAVGIGALQVESFTSDCWGIGFFYILIINSLVLIISVIGNMHEELSGIVTFKMILRQKDLIFMAIPFIVYALVFYYGPLVGWFMGFQNYKPALHNQAWVAWDKFTFLFKDKDFIMAFRNTVAMSLINLVLSFFFAITFALLLNEVVSSKGKKLVQTVSYLPHFLSWIIVAAIVRNVLAIDGGIINELLVSFNVIGASEKINFFADPKYFWWIVGFAFVWKETGWNSIIYLSAMTSISPELYEAAAIDGAGRFKRMIHITLPGIRPTVIILLIINLGMIMNSGFEAQYQLKTDLIKETAEVIDTYILNKSFSGGADFSLGTAAGIFKSVISIFLVSGANRLAKVFDQESLY